ncbi:MAG TPA: prepilin-type N-terminal cleavage/methylation domain-containing protein [Candidatus Baltobacteraceae bacterium]|nr:prepilin-type N-terminal cleavage/methylation domain-containing protein [Candidatus Baltobacteraceae bacterium]
MKRDQSSAGIRPSTIESYVFSSSRTSSFDPRRAFTLIELLVVIAIIAILAAMVMAVSARAKNTASKAIDINNLRQIMIALHSYTADSGDVLTPPNWDAGGFHGTDGNGTFTGWLYKPEPDLAVGDTNKFKVKTGLLWDTLRSEKIYFCPMDKPELARMSASQGAVMTRAQQISSYAMNGAVIGFNGMNYPPVKLAAMQPTDCAFWETDETDPYYFNDGANFPAEGVSPRHYQGGIQAAFDTSVSYVRLDKWYQDEADSNKNRLWCYPNSEDGR